MIYRFDFSIGRSAEGSLDVFSVNVRVSPAFFDYNIFFREISIRKKKTNRKKGFVFLYQIKRTQTNPTYVFFRFKTSRTKCVVAEVFSHSLLIISSISLNDYKMAALFSVRNGFLVIYTVKNSTCNAASGAVANYTIPAFSLGDF